MHIINIDERYSVSPQIRPEDIATLAGNGFDTVICNRPDHEEPGQPAAADIAAACATEGIRFYHIPFAALPIAAEQVRQHMAAVESSQGAVLGYCRSGQRSTVIYEAGIS